MKKYILIVLLFSCVSIAVAGNENYGNLTSAINTNDTIVIDLFNQILAGGKVSFPVSIISDDTIYALDFSFKYDETNFNYDTIINISPSLQSNSFYNTADSTVRYTSFSLDSLSKNTDLVTVRLNTFSSYMCDQDIYNIKGFLNGDACSIKLINCLSAGINDMKENNNSVIVYPNPANQILNVEFNKNATFTLLDLNGKLIAGPTEISKDENFQLSTKGFNNGVYFLKLYNDSMLVVKKVVVQH